MLCACDDEWWCVRVLMYSSASNRNHVVVFWSLCVDWLDAAHDHLCVHVAYFERRAHVVGTLASCRVHVVVISG